MFVFKCLDNNFCAVYTYISKNYTTGANMYKWTVKSIFKFTQQFFCYAIFACVKNIRQFSYIKITKTVEINWLVKTLLKYQGFIRFWRNSFWSYSKYININVF